MLMSFYHQITIHTILLSFIPFAHRNKNNTEHPIICTCQSTMEKLKNECKMSTAKKVYRNTDMRLYSILATKPSFSPKTTNKYRKLVE